MAYNGWPDCYQQRNATKLHCSVLYLLSDAKGRAREILLSHPEKQAGYEEAALLEGIKNQLTPKISF